MLKCLQRVNWKKVGLFAAGFAFGTAGVKILSSKDAKKVYTNCTAAVLRAKDSVMKTVNTVQENAGDILADAKAINEERAAKEAEGVEEYDYLLVNDDLEKAVDTLHDIIQSEHHSMKRNLGFIHQVQEQAAGFARE